MYLDTLKKFTDSSGNTRNDNCKIMKGKNDDEKLMDRDKANLK